MILTKYEHPVETEDGYILAKIHFNLEWLPSIYIVKQFNGYVMAQFTGFTNHRLWTKYGADAMIDLFQTAKEVLEEYERTNS